MCNISKQWLIVTVWRCVHIITYSPICPSRCSPLYCVCYSPSPPTGWHLRRCNRFPSTTTTEVGGNTKITLHLADVEVCVGWTDVDIPSMDDEYIIGCMPVCLLYGLHCLSPFYTVSLCVFSVCLEYFEFDQFLFTCCLSPSSIAYSILPSVHSFFSHHLRSLCA